MERNLNPVQSIDGIDSNSNQVGEISPRFGISEKLFVADEKGAIRFNTANAMVLMQNHRDWEDVVAYNEFAYEYVLTKEIPGTKAKEDNLPRRIRDEDLTDAVAWFNWNGFPTASKTVVGDVLLAHARLSVISPVRHYMDDLEWDGVQRLSLWLPTVFGAEDNNYTRAVGRGMLISAVARTYSPGCQVDTMVVFEGDQGEGKSKTMRTLCAGPDWFGDGLPSISANPKDASVYLKGKLIVEMAELDAMKKSDVERTKSFISRREEEYRPPYGKGTVREPRRSIFVGTTNEDAYLRDTTGNRRFWPVKTEWADHGYVEANRDQLWAEAVVAYRNDEPWWFTGEVERQAKTQQAKRLVTDPWQEVVEVWLAGRSEVSPAQIYREALGILDSRLSSTDARRIASILRLLGYKNTGQFSTGEYKGYTRYQR
ncbi:putative P-loop ATPase [Ruegeria sp. THAF57]|uniref:virulence-associated E family protein n=1 Tax=Ruegeria sp. THAF57 TaxID=2744555 RepID=UPI0015DDD6CD|nr:virulence-associated E family protein [Ruegeria sp. THAF57]CAD0183970.1 putative P-loop ATPase [Ruegeria sp. THAF57]